MKYFLVLILFSIAVFGQDAKFVPEKPQEIFKLKNTFELKDDTILNYSLIENDRTLLIVGKKNTQIWDIETKKIISETLHEIGKNHTEFSKTRISPDGKYFVIYDFVYSEKLPLLIKSKKKGAAIYNLQTGKPVKVLDGKDRWIFESIWSENGESFFTLTANSLTSEENELCFLDGETLEYRNCLPIFGNIWKYKFSKDGTKFFAFVSSSPQNSGANFVAQNSVRIWDTEKVKLLKTLKVDDQVRYTDDFFISTDEKTLSFGGAIFEIEGSDLPKFKIDNRIRGISGNGEYFIVKEKKGLQFYDFENYQRRFSIPSIKDDFQINLLTNEKILINQNLARNCGRTEGFEIETGKKLWEIKLACRWEAADCFFCSDKPDFNDSIDFLPNGNFFLTSSEKAVRVWNATTGELVQVLINPNKQKAKNSKFDDKINGEKKILSKNKRFIYVQDTNEKAIFHFELLNH